MNGTYQLSDAQVAFICTLCLTVGIIFGALIGVISVSPGSAGAPKLVEVEIVGLIPVEGFKEGSFCHIYKVVKTNQVLESDGIEWKRGEIGDVFMIATHELDGYLHVPDKPENPEYDFLIEEEIKK